MFLFLSEVALTEKDWYEMRTKTKCFPYSNSPPPLASSVLDSEDFVGAYGNQRLAESLGRTPHFTPSTTTSLTNKLI